MRLVIISDTHGFHEELVMPAGDMLIHAGDITKMGNVEEVEPFNQWLKTLPYAEKIVIAGNHDFCFEFNDGKDLITNAHYLQDSSITIEGIKFYGSPWQPRFFDWAFNLDRGAALKERWDLIPADTDVLITHGPPFGIADITCTDESVGCEELMLAIERVRPKAHIFGHIHEAYGVVTKDGTTFVNGSSCTLRYQAINAPICIDI